MRRCFLLLLLAALAPALRPACFAQSVTTSADYSEWNSLTQGRTSTTYHTIIGNVGTSFVTGSDYSDAFAPTLTIPLPFSLYYLGTLYPTGYNLRVSVGGFIGFDPGTTSGAWPYVLWPSGTQDHLIIPYWSDLMTTGGPNQGIYYRLDVDPTTYDSTLTIEWCVETMSAPHAHGRFQARMKQIRPGSVPYAWRSEIAFDYDRSSPLDRSCPGSYGAVIGLKNVGQGAGDPGPEYSSADDGRELMIVDPGVIVPDNAAITRLPTRGSYVPDWFANVTTSPSPYYHYTFPDSSCVILPIESDIRPDYMPPGGGPTTIGFPIVPLQSQPTLTILARNLGLSTEIDVPIHVVVRRDTVLVRDTVIHVDTLRGCLDAQVPFVLPSTIAGSYTVLTTITVQGDQNHANDSAQISYYVTPQHDGVALAISSPALTAPQPRYVAGAPIQITAHVANSGTLTSSFFRVQYTIYDEHDSVVAGRTDSVNGQLLMPGHDVIYPFGAFVPQGPGLYRVAVSCSAAGDQIPGNDLLFSIPRRDWTTHGPSPNVPGVQPIAFRVYPTVDLAVMPSPLCMPRGGDSVVHGTRLFALFQNNGGHDVRNAIVRAAITDAGGSTVYDRTGIFPTISGGGILAHYFPDFVPQATGAYCVTVSISSDSTEVDSTNNRASWCFTVADSSGDSGGSGLSLLDRGAGTPHLDASGPISAALDAWPGAAPAPASRRRRLRSRH